MRTNIIEYLMKVKKMTQAEIARELNSKDPEKKGITQAAISKWRIGSGKIPTSRQIELLKIAGLYWEIEAIDKDNPDDSLPIRKLDSNWNVLVQSEENQFLWIDYLHSLHPANEILNPNGEYSDDEYFAYMRYLLISLNLHGFEIPAFPPMPFEGGEKVSKFDQKIFSNFFRLLLLRISILQLWCIKTLPRKNINGFLEIYFSLSKIAIAQTVMDSPNQNSILPLSTDILKLERAISRTEEETKNHINNWLRWSEENSFPLIKESFNEILPPYSNALKKSDRGNKVNTKISIGEQKILEGIKKNEKLLNEILKRLDEK
jgi:hypothetical protein